ncbi:hypothetical protein [Streptomyces sp. G45]|uniref:hypothetical protein n=1 Tax=Streptomyces sp. G45 TaxID=3406627 RepID=UPI003C1D9941
MTRRRGRARGGRVAGVVLAGWLFADLLLVLALVSMADRPDPLANPRPKDSASAKEKDRDKKKPTGPPSVERRPEEFRVRGTDRGGIVSQIGRSTREWKGRRAALVLTFGGGQSGTVYAHRVNSLLSKGRPGMFTSKTATDDFHDLSSRPDTAVVRVYFFTRPGS